MTVDAKAREILKGSTVNEMRRPKSRLRRKNKQSVLTPSLVKVENIAGVEFKRGAVVGLGTPFPDDPTELEYEVNNYFGGVKPVCGTHDYFVAVTTEPLGAKELDPAPPAPPTPETPYVVAVIQGIVTVDVDVTQAEHRYAIIKTDDVDKFESSWAGYPIVWKPTGTGVKKCKVKIGSIADVLIEGTAAGSIAPDTSGTMNVTGGGTETVFLRPPHGSEQVSSGKKIWARRWWNECEWRIETADCE